MQVAPQCDTLHSVPRPCKPGDSMGGLCAPIEGIGHDEVLPEHEEDGGQD